LMTVSKHSQDGADLPVPNVQ